MTVYFVTRGGGRVPASPEHHAQYLAHKAVARAIRRGELAPARGQKCTDCGGNATEYDHRDYSKPLQVQAVCRKCNRARGPAIGAPDRKARVTRYMKLGRTDGSSLGA